MLQEAKIFMIAKYIEKKSPSLFMLKIGKYFTSKPSQSKLPRTLEKQRFLGLYLDPLMSHLSVQSILLYVQSTFFQLPTQCVHSQEVFVQEIKLSFQKMV